jgi:hypothetical protein
MFHVGSIWDGSEPLEKTQINSFVTPSALCLCLRVCQLVQQNRQLILFFFIVESHSLFKDISQSFYKSWKLCSISSSTRVDMELYNYRERVQSFHQMSVPTTIPIHAFLWRKFCHLLWKTIRCHPDAQKTKNKIWGSFCFIRKFVNCEVVLFCFVLLQCYK